MEEVLQELPRDQREALWGRLASLLQDVLLELPPERWEPGRDKGENREQGMEVEVSADPVSSLIKLDDRARTSFIHFPL